MGGGRSLATRGMPGRALRWEQREELGVGRAGGAEAGEGGEEHSGWGPLFWKVLGEGLVPEETPAQAQVVEAPDPLLSEGPASRSPFPRSSECSLETRCLKQSEGLGRTLKNPPSHAGLHLPLRTDRQPFA